MPFLYFQLLILIIIVPFHMPCFFRFCLIHPLYMAMHSVHDVGAALLGDVGTSRGEAENLLALDPESGKLHISKV